MIVRLCSRQPLLQPCSLEGHDYQLDPYIGCEHLCCYCYALKKAETDWKSEILTYRDLTFALERELLALEPQRIYMGWSSDPYQRAEETCLQTRRALELFAQRGFSVCVLTKSGLMSHDADLLARMPGSSAGISIAFQDERVRRAFEANAPPNQQRIEALAALKAAGISTYALICPVMPFITDVATLIERVAPHADTIYIYALSMEDEGDQNWRNLRSILERNYPDLSKRYRQIAFSTEHPYWAGLRKDLEAFQANSLLNLRIKL